MATDVASRGLDIDDIDVVVHLGCRNVDSFVHRSGRTGRAGKGGRNFVFTNREELVSIIKFAKDLKIEMEVGTTMIDDARENKELGIDWILSRGRKYYEKNPHDKELNELMDEFDLLRDDQKQELVRLMFNEKIQTFKRSESKVASRESLISGSTGNKTYILDADNELFEFFRENKMRYFMSEDKTKVMFEIFDSKPEFLERIEEICGKKP